MSELIEDIKHIIKVRTKESYNVLAKGPNSYSDALNVVLEGYLEILETIEGDEFLKKRSEQ